MSDQPSYLRDERSHQFLLEKMRLQAASRATTPAELKADILQYIEYLWKYESNRGATLRKLNRRFGIVAARIGVLVRNLLEQLCEERQVHYFEIDRRFIYCSNKFFDRLKDDFAFFPNENDEDRRQIRARAEVEVGAGSLK